MSDDELVVLVDDAGQPIGSARKSTVHHQQTPLHLAFSCYLFDEDGQVLLSRRALGKVTFPGVWTNSICGHPSPGEALEDAVVRRTRQELGVGIAELRCALPGFRYRAVSSEGIVENEICPVFCGLAVGSVDADPAEVMDFRWVSWSHLCAAADLGWAISPWASEQVHQLHAAGIGKKDQTV